MSKDFNNHRDINTESLADFVARLDEEMPPSDEKRKFIRFSLNVQLQLKPAMPGVNFMDGLTRNFSREGFSFVSENFTPGTDKTLEFMLTHPLKDIVVPVLGDVMWQSTIHGKSLAGIKFKQIESEFKVEILDHAYDIWLQDKIKSI